MYEHVMDAADKLRCDPFMVDWRDHGLAAICNRPQDALSPMVIMQAAQLTVRELRPNMRSWCSGNSFTVNTEDITYELVMEHVSSSREYSTCINKVRILCDESRVFRMKLIQNIFVACNMLDDGYSVSSDSNFINLLPGGSTSSRKLRYACASLYVYHIGDHMWSDAEDNSWVKDDISCPQTFGKFSPEERAYWLNHVTESKRRRTNTYDVRGLLSAKGRVIPWQ
jgi:hypothetical protein